MPELPEVETVRRGIEPLITDATIDELYVRRRDLRTTVPEDLEELSKGAVVTSVNRRAKYILLYLDNGQAVIIHLGMSGRIEVHKDSDYSHNQPAKHDHLIWKLTSCSGDRIWMVFNDARRFGLVTVMPQKEIDQYERLSHLSPDPLSENFDPSWLVEKRRNRSTSTKQFLMDQTVAAGMGNIYVSEAYHCAAISPKKMAKRLTKQECQALCKAIKQTLNRAIEAGGSTIRDYTSSSGVVGSFQNDFKVYGRGDEPCLREGCSGTVKKIVQSNRATYYCPKCQH